MELENIPLKSELALEHCLKLERPENYEQFKFSISECWYNQKVSLHAKQLNNPVVIQESQGDATQQLLAYWVQDFRQTKKDLVIPYLVQHENQNHSAAIYYILVKLRNILNLMQKVEVEGEKLQQYFDYWLESCNSEIQNQFYTEGKFSYKRIIIIFHALDQFRDLQGDIREFSWIPKILPSNIKFILSVTRDSKASEYFRLQGFPFISMDLEPPSFSLANNHNRDFQKIYSQLPESLRQSYFLLRFLLNTCATPNEDFQPLKQNLLQIPFEKLISEEDFFEQYLKLFTTHHAGPIYQNMLSIFSIVELGITYEELSQVCGNEYAHMEDIKLAFNLCVLEKNGLYSLYSLPLKEAILQLFPIQKPLFQQYTTMLEHSQNSLRKLIELIFHYGRSKNYFRLKEVTINIENFLLLWNPQNKFEICYSWQTLEQNGYDPVTEYNKAVENFIALSKPSNESLFFIVLQICQFLREFGNFENSNTPNYQHPELRGQIIEFQEIGLYDEFLRLDMLFRKKKELPLYTKVYKKKQQINPLEVKPETLKMETNFVRNLFISHYEHKLNSDLVQLYLDTKQEYLIERILHNSRGTQHYYYKRWIWVQFPWLALTSKQDFSSLMLYYNKDSNQYISVNEEKSINQRAIKLAMHTKLPDVSKIKQSNTVLRIRTFSPVANDFSFNRNPYLLECSTDRTLSKPKLDRSMENAAYPYYKKQQQQQQLDSLSYRNKRLIHKLKELETIKKNMYPSEINEEVQKCLDTIQALTAELKKQQEGLAQAESNMKRIGIVAKLCSNNSDYCEERAQILDKHSKNLDQIINEYKGSNKESQEKINTVKLFKRKQQQLPKKRIVQAKFDKRNKDTNASFNNQLSTDRQRSKGPSKSPPQLHALSPAQSSGSKQFFFPTLKSFNRNTSSSLRQETLDQKNETYYQLEIMGLIDDQHNIDQFIWSIQKQKEFTVQLEIGAHKLQNLKIKKEEVSMLLKILVKNQKKNSMLNEEETQMRSEQLRRQNELKAAQLKKLNYQKSAYRFFVKCLCDKVSKVQPIPLATIRHLSEALQMIQKVV